ncbi:MAG: LysM peptidoglycan-binding domain-containing protein [Ginsengibacter sp.]
MTRWLLTGFFTIITSIGLLAQQTILEIKGTGNNVYLDHTVAPKESLYSVGRMYNVAPKDLASFNSISIDAGLSVGQGLKIPLDRSNFTQSDVRSVVDFLIPVYHTVQSGETLYRLGVNYNKVPLESLKKWNSLSSDAVNVGSPMIVGFLKVDKNQSPLASSQVSANPSIGSVPAAEKPVENKPSVIEQVVKKEEVVARPEDKKEVVTQAPAVVNVPKKEGAKSGAGYFKPFYEQQSRENNSLSGNGIAGVFKSTSGWQDGKYYCFSNDAAPGSILKVTNNANGKIVFAKVLDAIPDIKQNAGLVVILSNAAADELEAGESRFDCSLEYMK